jgi:hypothetical protein
MRVTPHPIVGTDERNPLVKLQAVRVSGEPVRVRAHLQSDRGVDGSARGPSPGLRRLDEEQAAALRQHIDAKVIATTDVHWGQPTLMIRDLDENELFFWLAPRD